ncbi:MAG: hypothetical protein M3O50_01090 [Myxococcota bacterium]|nr:hypothetical protein [Myxococcota bacterium]
MAVAPAAIAPDAPDETLLRDPSDSQERLVAAEPLLVVRHESIHESAPRDPEADSLPNALATEFDELDMVADVEQAPISSRRPVAPQPEETLAQLAFGALESQPPRHVPPPESGQLLAIAEVEFDGDITGVRDSAPLSSNAPQQTVAAEVGGRPLERDSASSGGAPGLVPEAIRPQIGVNDHVIDVVGEAQRFAPSTFLALVESSLKL